MAILLYSEGSSGQIGLAADLIEGINAPARTYDIVNHMINVDGGGNDTVAARDAQEICRMAGFRMATPLEQNEYQRAKRRSGKLVESTAKSDVAAQVVEEAQ